MWCWCWSRVREAPCSYIQLSPEVPLATCIARSQIEAARWSGDHPGYEVRKIKV